MNKVGVAMLCAMLGLVRPLDAGINRGLHLLRQYPLPDSRYNTVESGLALTFNGPVAKYATDYSRFTSIQGEKSGPHAISPTFSEDGRSIILRPDHPFLPDEAVHVSFNGPVIGEDGTSLQLPGFTFNTGNRAHANGPVKPFEGEFTEAMPPQFSLPPASAPDDTLPLDFPYVRTTVLDSTSLAPGRLFLTNLTFGGPVIPYLMILDNSGHPVFYRKMPTVCTDFKPQPNGQLTYFQTQTGKFYVMDTSYTVVDSISAGNGYTADIHELRVLPNGHSLLLSYDSEYVDMSTVVPGGRNPARVIGLIIQELDIAKNVVFQWRSWDHFEITDATHEDLTAAQIDYVHGNAIDLDTDGNLLLSSRHLDEITKIDRDSGNVIWRLGGKNNQFTFPNDSIKFSHQHAIRRLANGHIILFDNGNFHTPSFSRAVEYALDESTKTATLWWQFRHSQSGSQDVYGQAMGDAQRLDNGNTLIGWGASSNPAITEVRPDGSVVFELNLGPGSFSYRSYRYLWKESTPETPTEVPTSFTLSQNYPNPFNAATTILILLKEDVTATFKIYDFLGRLIDTKLEAERKNPGRYYVVFDGSNKATGTYYYRLSTDKGTQVRAMQLVK
jgi:hypothetical protein